MLMIGTNNIGQSDPEPPKSAIEGIRTVVSELRTKLPDARILLLGVFPRGAAPDHPLRASIREINASIKRVVESDRHVRFLDLESKFLSPDGSISNAIMPDFLHLSREGYRIWAEAVAATIQELLRESK